MKWLCGVLAVAVILMGAVVYYAVRVAPDRIVVTRLAVAVEGWADGLKGRTAVHLTDLHIAKMGAREARVLEIVADIDPDMIFLTGDYIVWRGDVSPALTFLSKLRADAGVWAVMGDYDYSAGRHSCLFCHAPGSGATTRAHGARFLRNAAQPLVSDGQTVWVGGVDGEASRAFNAGREFLAGREGVPAILLSHSPLAFDYVDGTQPVLVLAGDTHGGQIPLPVWVWRLMGYDKNARYNQGWFEKGRARMYVNRGVGTSHLPLRLLRPPEVVVVAFY